MDMKCPKCQHENPEDSIYCAMCASPLKSAEDVSVTKTLETPSEQLSIDTTFAGRYHIAGELGKGGMGTVYKVHDTEIKEEVALKLLKPEIASDEHIIERFRNELKIARRVSHKHVCRMFDIGKEDEKYFITMEFVEGQDLKNHIKESERLSTEEAVSIAKQVCEGLTEAHRLGVVHRDLKPQNIMIDKEGSAKIMDFGIAMSVEAPGMTATGMIIGTPDYISPEQAEGQEADQRSDIYSLGVILYEMVTGAVPFKGDTALSVALKHKSQLPLDPRKFNPDVSDDLARLILICMEKDRGRRYQNAEALLDDLRNIEEGFPLGSKIRPRRETFVQALRRKKLLIPALVVALAVVAIAIWQLLPNKGAAYPPKIENSIAVISFANQSEDEALNMYQQVIPNHLITTLEQTDLFYVATWERMRDILKQMGKGDVEIIASDMGFEACRREGVQALVLGTYTKIGETFATDVKVLDVDTKQLLKAASSRGEGVGSIFDQIDELSKQISEGMGISVQKIEESYTSIKDLTTDSPEAYNYYIRGVEEDSKLHGKEALQFLEKAIELDPDFAMAYYRLGTGHLWGATRPKDWREYIKKAKSLSDRVSDKEKLMIERAYASRVERNSEKAHDILKLLLEKYPKEKEFHMSQGFVYWGQGLIDEALEEFDRVVELDPHYGWGFIRLVGRYYEVGNFEKALEYAKKAVSACPGDPNPLDSMGQVYVYMGDLENALIKYKETLEVKPDWPGAEESIAYIYALKENYPETLRWIDSFIAKAPTIRIKAYAHWWKGFYHAWLGNSARSFECLDKVAELLADESGGWRNPRRFAEWLKGCIYLDRGDHKSASKHFQIFLDRQSSVSGTVPNILRSFLLGLLDVREGNINSAKSRLREMEPILPEMLHPFWKKFTKYYYEFLNAEVYVSEHPLDEAIVASINDSIAWIPAWINAFSSDIAWYNFPFQKDMIARAYLRKGDLDKAINWYEQHIAISPHDNDRRLIHPKYHYKLALLYEEKGKISQAIAQYEKFLDLWKDADPGIAEVEDAHKRLAGLKGH